jgi:hypothetical protein
MAIKLYPSFIFRSFAFYYTTNTALLYELRLSHRVRGKTQKLRG